MVKSNGFRQYFYSSPNHKKKNLFGFHTLVCGKGKSNHFNTYLSFRVLKRVRREEKKKNMFKRKYLAVIIFTTTVTEVKSLSTTYILLHTVSA